MPRKAPHRSRTNHDVQRRYNRLWIPITTQTRDQTRDETRDETRDQTRATVKSLALETTQASESKNLEQQRSCKLYLNSPAKISFADGRKVR